MDDVLAPDSPGCVIQQHILSGRIGLTGRLTLTAERTGLRLMVQGGGDHLPHPAGMIIRHWPMDLLAERVTLEL
jgi:hypothetical protein